MAKKKSARPAKAKSQRKSAARAATRTAPKSKKGAAKAKGAKATARAKPQTAGRAKAGKRSAKPQASAVPAPPPAPPMGTVVWHELMTNNAQRCGEFYQGLFNWGRRDKDMIPGVTYTLFRTAGRDVAGMMTIAGPDWEGQAPAWIPYVKVRDVDAAALKATQLGGRVLVPPSDLADGRFAVVADPGGAAIGLFKSEIA